MTSILFSLKLKILQSDLRLSVLPFPALTGLIAKPLAEFEKLNLLITRIEINSYQNINDIQPENFDLIVCLQTLPNVRMIAYDIASISYGILPLLTSLRKTKDL